MSQSGGGIPVLEKLPTAAELIAFEQEIAELFNAGKIRAPVHLSGGNEEKLIHLFKFIQSNDWVCTNWRSHYHCLLKGVPQERLKEDILCGKSITLCYPEYKIISSAIVGGICPIALGIAAANKYKGPTTPGWVWCFVGDMTARSGIFSECVQYARGHDLPIEFVVEHNGISVQTPTAETWGDQQINKFTLYNYKLPWPHSGAGKRVEF